MRRHFLDSVFKAQKNIPVMLPDSQFQIKTVSYVKSKRRLYGLAFSELREEIPVMPPDRQFFK